MPDTRRPSGPSRSITLSPAPSPPTSPLPGHSNRSNKNASNHKHAASGSRLHTRVPSSKALHNHKHKNSSSSSALAREGGAGEGEVKRNTSAGNLKRNSSGGNIRKGSTSAAALKRNRSAPDVKKEKGEREGKGVRFEIGRDGDEDEAWESSSASPALSRSVSRAANHSGQSSVEPSRPQSPAEGQPEEREGTVGGGEAQAGVGGIAGTGNKGRIITEKLLQRTPSHGTTGMSLATAVPVHSDQDVNTPTTPGGGQEYVSRFVGSSGIPSEPSSFRTSSQSQNQHQKQSHSQNHSRSHSNDEPKRAHSMHNLTRNIPSSGYMNNNESALQTTSGNPSQPSRTQQKLWLQRASSAIEPASLPTSLFHGSAVTDPRDPRIRMKLEAAGCEYAVVRRYQDLMGNALRRLDLLEGGARGGKQIPVKKGRGSGAIVGNGNSNSVNGSGPGMLSQSLRERGASASAARAARVRAEDVHAAEGQRRSYERGGDGSAGSAGDGAAGGGGDAENDGVQAILRALWEKRCGELSASTD